MNGYLSQREGMSPNAGTDTDMGSGIIGKDIAFPL